ncbi:MAG: endonuclease/exonuclease/phosphatase family protein [Prevotella sp.]
MIKQLKSITVNIVAGVNTCVVVLMLITAYSDHFNPTAHAFLSVLGLGFPVMLLLCMCFVLFWAIFKWRYILITFAGYLLAIPSIRVYVPYNSVSKTIPQGCIKVLSYNVQAYTGAPRYTDCFDTIINYVRQCDADIVCVQEDMNSTHDTRAEWGKLYAYCDTFTVSVPGAANGIGLYSRYPILRRERIIYSSLANMSMAYFLQKGSDTIIVVNNHLESNHLSEVEREGYRELIKGDMSKEEAKVQSKMLIDKLTEAAVIRAPQADSVAAFIRRHSGYPIIVCGDFNDNPISYARRTIAQNLTDCYVATAKGAGWSYNQKGFYVRIDNILCSSHFKPYNCKIDKKIDASDHYPIFCWLKLQGEEDKKSRK